ncbi:MAG: hypothetical protein JSW54_11330 [Fidelibacterota bacterium]|nr:MAG: hypothetical protein JSW54_11330 [Candidatus Neomarinimicrobiota bacterium]
MLFRAKSIIDAPMLSGKFPLYAYRMFLLAFLILSFGTLPAAAEDSAILKSIVKVKVSKDGRARISYLMSNGFDLAGYDRASQELLLIVDEEQLVQLRSSGLSPEIIYLDANLELSQKTFGYHTAQRAPSGKIALLDTTLGPYHTYQEMMVELALLADSYPSLARLDSLGASLEGRTIWGLKISDNVQLDEIDESEVLYMGNHHARELISVEIPLHFARHLLEGYESDPRIASIVNSRQIWIIPMVNPDGHIYVEKFDRMWRKNRRDNGDGTFGVDLNRNYAYQWGYDSMGSSSYGGDYNYRGAEPWSEPETRAIRDFVETHRFTVAFTYHASGNIYIYPWGYINAHTPDHPVFEHMAIRLSMLNNYRHGNGVETLNYLMNGEAVDWLYGESVTKPAIIAMTVEVGTGSDGFLPDTSRIMALILQNLEANLLLAEWADNPAQVVPTVPQPTLSSVLMGDSGEVVVRWENLDTTGLGGFRLFTEMEDSWLLAEDESTILAGTSDVTLPAQGENYYKIAAVDTAVPPRSGYDSDIYGAYLEAPAPAILIVDGFDRNDGSWTHLAHPFAKTAGESIAANGWNFQTCDNDALLAGNVRLEDYYAVVWCLGDESTEHETFSTAEQDIVRAYLENGGRLFISGSEIGWDLVQRGSSSDMAFYHNYLKASYIGDDSNILSAMGVPGTTLDGLSVAYGDPSDGAPYREDYPDIIAAMDGSIVCLVYTGGSQTGAGIQYEGVFGDSQVPGKLVYLAFPFETIHTEPERTALMGEILDFFSAPLSTEMAERSPVREFRIYQNYPNPFNPATAITYEVPQPGRFVLEIFNIRGQGVRTLIDQQLQPGRYEVFWDGRNAAGEESPAGIYVCRFQGQDFYQARKMLLLK